MSAKLETWARNAAFHYVERFATSEANLRRVMERKVASKKRRGNLPEDVDASEAITKAIAFLVENGLVNDTSFADMKTRSGQSKGKSRSRIVRELSAKGIDREIAEASTNDIDDFHQAIRHAQRKRIGPFRNCELNDKIKRREFGSFARAGFPPPIFMKVLEMDRQEAEEHLFHVELEITDAASTLP